MAKKYYTIAKKSVVTDKLQNIISNKKVNIIANNAINIGRKQKIIDKQLKLLILMKDTKNYIRNSVKQSSQILVE